jgi:S-adenosylmethionine synthetase
MPAPISYSHKVLQLMSEARKSGKEKFLRPDSKSQFSVIYEKGKPKAISSIVVSTQHDESVDQEKVKEIVRPYVLSVIPKGWMCDEKHFYVNPTGRFVIGGPDGDTGLTGRKIIVDTYGGAAPHGGGAFSGKDPTKVDRSAAYVARYLAKNIVAAGVSEKCLIQLSYAIGVSQPLSIYIDLFDGEDKKSKKIEEIISKNFNLSPRGIRELLKLNKPIYQKTAAYGHFGRQPEDNGSFSWEKTDLIKYFQSKV